MTGYSHLGMIRNERPAPAAVTSASNWAADVSIFGCASLAAT